MNRKKILVIGASIITVILVIAAFIFWPRRLLPKSAMLQLDAVTIKIADGKCTGITGISVEDQKKVRMILQKYTCHLCADPQRVMKIGNAHCHTFHRKRIVWMHGGFWTYIRTKHTEITEIIIML